MSINEIKDFNFENYYRRIEFSKKTSIIQWKKIIKKNKKIFIVDH